MVDIATMLTPAIADLIKKFAEKGLDSHEAAKELDMLSMVMRERVRRDMRYNAELMSDARLDPPVKILNFETEALDFVCEQGIPLAMLFNRSLSEAQQLSFAGADKSHIKWFRELDTEAKLVERTLHRAKIAQLKAKYGLPVGDITYLRKLTRAVEIVLS